MAGLTNLEMKRTGCMQDSFEAGRLDDLVKGTLDRNVWHNDCLEPVLTNVCVRFVDLGGLVLGADGRHHGVAALQQCLEDVSCDFLLMR